LRNEIRAHDRRWRSKTLSSSDKLQALGNVYARRSGAQIGIVTLPRASITAHVRLANGRFVMVYPVVPSMNEAERDSKYLEACDFGKPLRRFRRHQS
jgi:hypothetical protein